MTPRNFSASLLPLDRIFDSLGEIANERLKMNGFPYYDIIKTDENSFRLVFALAGYSEEEIEVLKEGQKLTVSATKVDNAAETKYIHRGITKSAFSRSFQLLPYSVIESAELKNGLLTIDVKIDLPEEQKPRKIEIVTKDSSVEATEDTETASGE